MSEQLTDLIQRFADKYAPLGTLGRKRFIDELAEVISQTGAEIVREAAWTVVRK